MRITKLHPTTDWAKVWSNLHTTRSSDTLKATWYMIIHDILPTNERLHAIHLTVYSRCRTCGENDTIKHPIAECDEGAEIRRWTRVRIAAILRKDQSRIPLEWILLPEFHIRPPRRHGAVFWNLEHMVWYRMQERRNQSTQDYSDFLRRARLKADQAPGRVKKVGNYRPIL
jgi:hypothetical protein